MTYMRLFGSTILWLAFALVIPSISYAGSQTFTSSGSFTVPAGVTSINATVIGGGGGGGGTWGRGDNRAGGGAGSGGFSVGTYAVTPGSVISVTVGQGGTPAAFVFNYNWVPDGTYSTDYETGATYPNYTMVPNYLCGPAGTTGTRDGAAGGNSSISNSAGTVTATGGSGGTGSGSLDPNAGSGGDNCGGLPGAGGTPNGVAGRPFSQNVNSSDSVNDCPRNYYTPHLGGVLSSPYSSYGKGGDSNGNPGYVICPARGQAGRVIIDWADPPPQEPAFSATCTLQSTGLYNITMGWAGVAGAVNYPLRLSGPSRATNAGRDLSFPYDVIGGGVAGDAAPTASGFVWTGLSAPGTYSHWGHAWNTNGWSTATTRTVTCPVPTGTISGSPNPCTIPSGGSVCSSTLTWNTYNGISGGSAGVWVDGSLFSSNISGSQVAPWIGISGSTFILKSNSGSTLAQTTVSGVCASGTSWNGSVCSPVVNGACGAAATNYAASATSYSGAFCSTGTASPASPAFPSQGGSTSWTCMGSGTGAINASCTATRAVAGTPPATPTGLTATPSATCGSGQITLSWNASSGATSYTLYRNGVQIYSGAGTSFTDSGLAAGTSYNYTVLASNANGSSAQSSAVSGTAPAVCAGNQPPNVNAGADRSITLPTASIGASGASASDPDGSIASLSWSFVSGPATPTISSGTTLTPTFSNMTVAGTYTFRLTATDNLGLSANDTMQVLVAAAGTPPSTPTGLTATPSATCGTGQINISWNASAGATYYIVTRNGPGSDYLTTFTSFSDTGLAAGSSNTYSVIAVNNTGRSATSSPVSANAPAACPTTCTGASNVTVTGAANTSGGTVWGTDTYTDDSDLGKAAVHAGILSVGQTGTIRMTKIGDRTGFVGSTRNSIITSDYAPSWCAMTLSAVDLVPQIVSAPAASVTAGNTITLTANVRNQGSASSGDFSNNMTYQWNGTGGTWKSFSPAQTFLKTSLAGGTTASNDTYSFSTTTTGTLYLQYCADAIPASGTVSESNEGNNCWRSTGTVVSAPAGNCTQQTLSNCSLQNTANGGTSGSCATGYLNTCSYTCSNSTWIQNGNTCALPTITTFRVCMDATGTCTSAPNTHTVPVSTPLTLTWASNGDSCSAVTGTGFLTGGLPNGSDGITSAATPNTTTTYTVACSYGGGTPVQRSLNVLTSSAAPTLSVSKSTVSAGDSITLSWDTNNGDEGSCSLTGGGLTSATLTNGTGDAETGSTSVTITGRTTFTLSCGGLMEVRTMDVIPSAWES